MSILQLQSEVISELLSFTTSWLRRDCSSNSRLRPRVWLLSPVPYSCSIKGERLGSLLSSLWWVVAANLTPNAIDLLRLDGERPDNGAIPSSSDSDEPPRRGSHSWSTHSSLPLWQPHKPANPWTSVLNSEAGQTSNCCLYCPSWEPLFYTSLSYVSADGVSWCQTERLQVSRMVFFLTGSLSPPSAKACLPQSFSGRWV